MRIKVYLDNSNSQAYHVVRKILYPVISKIEYTNNVRAADLKINCQYINKDNIHQHKAKLLNEIEIKHKELNPSVLVRG